MTRADHVSCSDRMAEGVTINGLSDDEVVVKDQCDEPLIPSRLIDQVSESLARARHAVMSTAAKAIEDDADILNPNVVKVVFARNGQAMYFSRAPIPFARDERTASAWHHIGIYAYRAGYLRRYPELPASAIETTESLEQLRVLDNGDAIMVEQVDYFTGIGVDTPQDLERARAMLAANEQGVE